MEALTPEKSATFQTLIKAVTAKLELELPQKVLPYSVDKNSTDYQVGCDLFQSIPEEERRSVGYWSGTLIVHERNYSVPKEECLTVIWVLAT